MIEQRLKALLITILVFLAGVISVGLFWFLFGSAGLPEGAGWYLFSFASGLTMIVLPCTLPLAFVIVPLSMKKGLVKGVGIAIFFGIGVAITLSMYGVLAAIVGKVAIGSLAVELEVVKNWVYFIAGIFAYLFALGEIGLINVRMPSYTGSAPGFIQKQQDYIKALLLGLFLGNIGVGCPHPATPLLLVEIATSANVFYGWILFLIHAVGRILPLLFLAFLGLLGVNGLSWLVARKDKVERGVGWTMVFVAGFILVLGLFTHDWWVNSGIHTQFEKVTQEATLTEIIRGNLQSEVTHAHGIEEGTGLFGLPLNLGNWVLVALWVLPIWIWWYKKRRRLYGSPAMRIAALEADLEGIEKHRRAIEAEANLDELTKGVNIKQLEEEMDALRKKRLTAEEGAQFGESDAVLANPLARQYEKSLLTIKKSLYVCITLLLAFVFIYYLPHNFLEHTALEHGHGVVENGEAHDHSEHEQHMMNSGSMGAMFPTGATFSRVSDDLPQERSMQIVELEDGDVYEVEATVIQKQIGNRTLKMLAYNGSVPGPLIKARQGAEVIIRFINNSDVESTIHHHGVRVDNRFDGVSGSTQDAVAPGDTFEYKVKFKDAGIYWYHPHVREDYAQEHGLYGNYLIEPLDPAYWSPVNREVPLILDDILLDNGSVAPFYKDFVNFALLGRFGNTYLVNGSQDFILEIESGEVVRFPVTNAASVRPFKISIPGARMKLVGADIGKYEREEFIDNFLIMPAERVVVEAYFDKPGLYKITHTAPGQATEIGYVRVSNRQAARSYAREFNILRTNQDVLDELRPLRRYFSAPVDKRLRLSVDLGGAMVDHGAHAHGTTGDNASADHGGHAHVDGGTPEDSIQWDDAMMSDAMNTSETVTWKIIDEDTGKENMDINWNFSVGNIVKVSIFNDPQAEHVMQHPIHFHGQRFLILSRDGVEESNKAWKDTVQVLPGESVEILVEMSNPGVWMSHCHIAEHLHSGMMFGFRVEDTDGSAPGDAYRIQAGVMEPVSGFIIPKDSLGFDGGYYISRIQDSDPAKVGVLTTLKFTAEGRSDAVKKMFINNVVPYHGGQAVRLFGIREQGDQFFVTYINEVEPGVYEGEHRFILPGVYKLFAEVNFPGGPGNPWPIFSQEDLVVEGDAAVPERVSQEINNNVIVGDFQVALSHSELSSSAQGVLNLVVTDIFGGGVELEDFNGEIMDIDIFRDDLAHYTHLRPAEHLHSEDVLPLPAEDVDADDGHMHDDGHDHTHSYMEEKPSENAFASTLGRFRRRPRSSSGENLLTQNQASRPADAPQRHFSVGFSPFPIAYAHGEIPGAVAESGINVFELPALKDGIYTMLVHFRPANAGLPEGKFLTARFNLRVPAEAVGEVVDASGTASVERSALLAPRAPWYASGRWWGLLIISLILMGGMSWGVKRYLR
jgi:FtsP/CotA-like multicopper oxidase with cupredoxin domain/cytochrome c biogenesis protein CcdA